MRPRQYVVLASFVALTAGCGSEAIMHSRAPTTTASTTSVLTSSSTPTASVSAPPSSATAHAPTITKTFLLAVTGNIPTGDSFQLFFNANASPDLVDFCGQTGPPRPSCVSGKEYTRQFVLPINYQGLTSAPWRFERVTASGQVIVFKQGSTFMSQSETITAAYTYP